MVTLTPPGPERSRRSATTGIWSRRSRSMGSSSGDESLPPRTTRPTRGRRLPAGRERLRRSPRHRILPHPRLAPAGGWQKVGSASVRDEIPRSPQARQRLRVLLLADFDGQGADGFERVFGNVPPIHATALSFWGRRKKRSSSKRSCTKARSSVSAEPLQMAAPTTRTAWDSPQLRDNKEELARLHASVAAFLLRVP